LTLKDLLKAVVVSHRRQHGSVGGQGNRRQGSSFGQKSRKKFRRQMLRVGGAAAISRNYQFGGGT